MMTTIKNIKNISNKNLKRYATCELEEASKMNEEITAYIPDLDFTFAVDDVTLCGLYKSNGDIDLWLRGDFIFCLESTNINELPIYTILSDVDEHTITMFKQLFRDRYILYFSVRYAGVTRFYVADWYDSIVFEASVLDWDFIYFNEDPNYTLSPRYARQESSNSVELQAGEITEESLPDILEEIHDVISEKQDDVPLQSTTDTSTSSPAKCDDDKITEKDQDFIDKTVGHILGIFSSVTNDNMVSLVSKLETLFLAGLTVNAQCFWKKLLLGLGTLYKLSVDDSILLSMGPYILEKLFGTRDLQMVSMYTTGLKDNLHKSRLYDLIAFILMPFHTTPGLETKDLIWIHGKTVKEIEGLDVLDAIVKGCEFISTSVEAIKETKDLSKVSVSDLQMQSLLHDYTSINSDFIAWQNDPGLSIDFNQRMMAVEKLLKDAQKSLTRSKSVINARSISLMIFSLSKIHSSYVAKSKVGTLVEAAFAFLVFSTSQVGKSTFTKYTMEHIMRLIYPDVDDKIIKTARGDEKFLEHIDNEDEFLILDDLCNVNPEFTTNSPLDLFLRLRNNISTPLDQADLVRKGKICPTFKAIGCTTNISDLNVSKYTIMGLSIMLRFNCIINITVNPLYATANGTLDQSKVLTAFPLRDGKQPLCDIWDINVFRVCAMETQPSFRQDFVNQNTHVDVPWCLQPVIWRNKTMAKVNFKIFMEYIADTLLEYRLHQKQLVAGLDKTDYTALYCYKCKNDLIKCSCTEVQSGILQKNVKKLKRTFVDKLSSYISKDIDDEIADTLATSNASFSGIFGVHLTKERFYDRIKIMLDLVLTMLEETKYLHVLTHVPANVFDKLDTEIVIKMMETDKISKMIATYVISYGFETAYYMFAGLHFGLLGLLTVFLSKIGYDFGSYFIREYTNIKVRDTPATPEHAFVLALIKSLSTVTYVTYVVSSVQVIYNHASYDIDLAILGLAWPYFFKFCELSGYFRKPRKLTFFERAGVFFNTVKTGEWVPQWNIQKLYYDKIRSMEEQLFYPQLWQYTNNTFYVIISVFVLFSLLYLYYDLYWRTKQHVDTYCTRCVNKIQEARKFIEPYKGFVATKVVPKIEPQAGKEDFYIKEWERFNKDRFELHMRSKNEIDYAMKHNLVNVTYNKETAMGFILRTGKMLLPSHFIPAVDTVATCTRYSDKNIGNRKFMITLSPILCTHISNKDAVVIDFVDGGTFSDTTRLFPTQMHVEVDSGLRYHKTGEGETRVIECTSHEITEVRTNVYSNVAKVYLKPAIGFAYGAENGTGLCGGVIISGGKKTYIKGIHIAGCTANKFLSYGIPILYDELVQAMEKRTPMFGESLELTDSSVNPWGVKAEAPLPKQSPSVYISDDRSFGFLGRMGGYNTPQDKIRRHIISEKLEEKGYKCQWGSPLPGPGERRHQATDAWLEKATVQQKPVSAVILQKAREDWMEPLKPIFTSNKRVRVLTRKEIVNGAPGEVFLNSIDLTTSTGFPHFTKKTTIASVDDSGIVSLPEEIWGEVKFLEDTLSNKMMPRIPATLTTKMEVRKLGKGERKFNNLSLCLTLVIRKYFGAIFSVLVEHRFLSECMVGINPYGTDWNDFYQFLYQGPGTRWHAFDIKNFDLSIIVMIMHAYLTCLVEFADLSNFTPYNLTIMRGVITLLSTPCVLVDGDLLELVNVMLSGIYGTTHMDSGILSLMMRYAFFKVYGPTSSLRFRDNCRLGAFGDDLLLTTRWLYRFDSVTFAQLWEDHGITVTDGNKNKVLKSCDDFSEITFLKRSFRWCYHRQRWVAPIAMESLLKQLHCYHISKFIEPNDVLVINLKRVVMELSLHTESNYNTLIEDLRSIDDPIISRVPSLNWDYLTAINEFEKQLRTDIKDTYLSDGVNKIPVYFQTVEVQSGNLKDVPQGAKVEETVTFEMPENEVTLYSSVGSREARADTNLTVQQFLGRPIRILTTEFTPTGLSVGASVYPYTVLLSDPGNANRINNYKNFAADIEFTIINTASPYYYGQFIVYYEPTGRDDFTQYIGSFEENILMFQQKHVIVNLGDDEGAKFTVPFFYSYDYFNLTAGTNTAPNGIGKLYVRNTTAIRAVGEIPSSPATITVMARFVNVRVRGVTELSVTTISPQSGELDDKGPVSKVASSIAKYANHLSAIPYIGRYAIATELASTAVGSIASLFGFSRPHLIKNPDPAVLRTQSNLAVTDQADDVQKLTVDSRQQLTIDPLAGGIVSYDPLSIAAISTQQCYLRSFDWDPTSVKGTSIGAIRVDPTYYHYDLVRQDMIIPSLAAVSLPFEYYTGTLTYTFVAIGSKFHRGRLIIQYDPGADTPPTDIRFNTNMCYELDLQGNNSVSFSVGNNREWGYIPMWGIPFVAGPTTANSYFSSTTVVDFRNNNYGNGSIRLMVLNQLNAPAAGVGSNAVTIQVFVKAEADFRLAKPSAVLEHLVPVPMPEPQSGTLTIDNEHRDNQGSGTIHGDIDLDYMGETIRSLRQLCKRYTYYKYFNAVQSGGTSSSVNVGFILPGFLYYTGEQWSSYPTDIISAKPYNVCFLTYYQYCALMHHGVRGSIRYKVLMHTDMSTTGGRGTLWAKWLSNGYDGLSASIGFFWALGNSSNITFMNMIGGGPTGWAATAAALQPVLEFENPYQHHSLFEHARVSDEMTRFNKVKVTYSAVVNATTQNTTWDVMAAAGEDFQVYWFRGLPRMKWRAEIPSVL